MGYLWAKLEAFCFTAMFATNEEETERDASHSEISKGVIGIVPPHKTVKVSICRRELNSSVHFADVSDHGYSMHAEMKQNVNQQGVDCQSNHEYIVKRNARGRFHGRIKNDSKRLPTHQRTRGVGSKRFEPPSEITRDVNLGERA